MSVCNRLWTRVHRLKIAILCAAWAIACGFLPGSMATATTNSEPPTITLLKDIYAGSGSSFPFRFVELGGKLYFTAYERTHGQELWVSDGTPGGTQILKDIVPGDADTKLEHLDLFELRRVDNRLFLENYHRTDRIVRLWTSDGTAAGTTPVQSYIDGTSPYASVGQWLFFVAYTEEHGYELWKTNGVPADTMLVKDLTPGPDSSSVRLMTTVNGLVYMIVASDQERSLWRSDGTEAGTQRIKVLSTTGNDIFSPMVTVGSLIFWLAQGQLWRSDGTETGTFPLMLTTTQSYYGPLVNLNSTLFFVTPVDGQDTLWKSDGSLEGTAPLNPADPGATGTGVGYLKVIGGFLYYGAGAALWRSDGSLQGTTKIADILPNSEWFFTDTFTAYNGYVYFFVLHYDDEMQLWRTDGSTGGTELVRPFNGVHLPDANPQKALPTMFVLGQKLYFAANDGATGVELWTLTAPPPLQDKFNFLPLAAR